MGTTAEKKGDKIILRDVRLAFPNLFEAAAFTDPKTGKQGDPQFQATFLLDRTDPKTRAVIEAEEERIAKEKWGAKAVGITLSQNQYDLARERIARAGLSDRCEVRLEDYRDMSGKFDRISSVGMFEHVGLKNLRDYFRRVHDLLADDGIVLNHGAQVINKNNS